MNNIKTQLALGQLRAARDLIMSAHVKLKEGGASG
jgi:hypothetical protein